VQTLDALRPVLGDDAQVHIEDGLYGASQHGLLRLLRTLGPSVSSPIVIGHNPGLEDLALGLAGDGEPAALHQLHAKFPTAALAVFDLQQDAWARLGRGQGYLKEIVLPRDLPD
jgi:phosphohistidine phosphatase